MPVSENETALSRGRVPTYMRRQLNDLMAVLLQSNSSRLRVATLTFFLFDEDILVHLHRRRRRHRDMILSLFMVMQNHYTSYDMVVWPTLLFRDPPIVNPIEELTPYRFYQNSGFWPDQFLEISQNLILIPDVIVCDRTRCSARKELALFVLLRRWNKADNWENISFCTYIQPIIIY